MKSAIDADRSRGEVLKCSLVDVYANNTHDFITRTHKYEYV